MILVFRIASFVVKKIGRSYKCGFSSIDGGSSNVVECMEHCVVNSMSIEEKFSSYLLDEVDYQ